MVGGTIIAMPNNPPRYEAINCQCQCKSGKCQKLLWSRFPAVRTMRGKLISATCAVNSGIASWEELDMAWRELVASGGLPERVGSSQKSKKSRSKKPTRKISSGGKFEAKKTMAQVAQEALSGDRGVVHDGSSALEAALWENAPEGVKKKKRRRRKPRKSG